MTIQECYSFSECFLKQKTFVEVHRVQPQDLTRAKDNQDEMPIAALSHTLNGTGDVGMTREHVNTYS